MDSLGCESKSQRKASVKKEVISSVEDCLSDTILVLGMLQYLKWLDVCHWPGESQSCTAPALRIQSDTIASRAMFAGLDMTIQHERNQSTTKNISFLVTFLHHVARKWGKHVQMSHKSRWNSPLILIHIAAQGCTTTGRKLCYYVMIASQIHEHG